MIPCIGLEWGHDPSVGLQMLERCMSSQMCRHVIPPFGFALFPFPVPLAFLVLVPGSFPLFGVSPMSIRIAFTAAAMTVAVTQAASAAMITFTNATLWNGFSAGQGASVATENFNSYNGFYANGLSGNAGGIQWTASAPGSLYAGSGYMSTNTAEALLTFTLAPSVQGVAGNFFATDINYTVLPAIIGVTLGDGSSYIGYAASASDFVGFYSTGAAIASISVSVAGNLPAGTNFATVDNLYFAVPAPGALALIGVAGLVGARRARR